MKHVFKTTAYTVNSYSVNTTELRPLPSSIKTICLISICFRHKTTSQLRSAGLKPTLHLHVSWKLHVVRLTRTATTYMYVQSQHTYAYNMHVHVVVVLRKLYSKATIFVLLQYTSSYNMSYTCIVQ